MLRASFGRGAQARRRRVFQVDTRHAQSSASRGPDLASGFSAGALAEGEKAPHMTGSKRAQAAQPGILEPIPRAARYLSFGLKDGAHAREALRALAKSADGKACVVGLGALLLFALKKETEGLRPFPHYRGEGFEVPSTPAALWCWLRGEDRGEIVLRGGATEKMLAPAFEATSVIDAFKYGRGLDLTGYEDGTENPRPYLKASITLVASNAGASI